MDEEPDDGLTCDPCKEWRCDECEGGCCWHDCPDDDFDPAYFRPVETVELPGVSR